jgi:tape measure domain-containing protein
MAMSLDTAIKFTAKLEGSGLDQLKRSLQGLAQQSKVTKVALGQANIDIERMARAAGNTTAGLRNHIAALKQLRDNVDINSQAYRRLGKQIDELEAKQRKLSGAGSGRGGLFGMIGGSGLAGLAAAAGGGLAVKYIADAGLAAESAQVRLRALSDQFGEYNQAQAATARIAETLRLSTTEAADGFASLYASLRPTGIGIKELEDAYIGFSAAARNSGATAQETSNALIQLKQGLASGVLQGEELRSIREQAPLVAQAIAKELGVTIGELKGLAAEGKVTTDVVLSALGKLKGTQLGTLNQQFQTGAQALRDLQIELEKAAQGIAKAFGPTAIKLLRAFTSAVERISDALGLTEGAAGRREDRIRADMQANRESNAKFGIGGVFRYGFQIDEFQDKRSKELFAQFQAERQRAAQKAAGLEATTADQREAREAAAAERQAGRDRARAEALKEQLKVREDMEEKLADAAQKRAQDLADFQKESIRRAAQLERDLGDQRLSIEREIADTRSKIQATVEDRALEAEKQRLAAAGLSTEGIDTAKEVKEIFRRYDEQRIQNDRNAVDRQTDLQRRLEEFKTQTADGIGRIQEGYARSVSNILQDAGKKLGQLMEAGAQNAASTLTGAGGAAAGGGVGGGFVTGGNLSSQAKALVAAAAKLGVSPLDLATIIGFETGGTYSPSKMGGAGGNYMGLIQFGPNERRQYGAHRGQSFEEQVQGPVVRYFQDRFKGVGMSTQGADLLTLYRTVLGGNPKASLTGRDAFGTSPQSGVAAMAPHRAEARRRFFSGATISGFAGSPISPTMTPPPAGFDPSSIMGGINKAGSALGGAIDQNKRQQQLLTEEQTLAALEQKYTAITGELNQQLKASGDRLRDEKLYSLLLAQGVTPELAKQRVELEATAAVEKSKLESLQVELEARIAILPVESSIRKELEKQVEKIKERLRLQGEVINKTEEQTEAERKAREEREKKEKRAEEWKQLYANIGGTLSEGIIGGIDAAIEAAMTGADNLGDTLKGIASGVLKDIGNMLLRFGLNSLLGGAFGGGFFKFANGGVMTGAGAAPLKRYAAGGIANRPQLALYGEGSKPEAYVPLPDGRRIPVALQGDKMRDAMGSGPMQAATSPVLNMSFQSTNIGGVEYVSRDQLESAMSATRRQAARDGAKRGMSMTLDKLQQSPSTRSRVGLR